MTLINQSAYRREKTDVVGIEVANVDVTLADLVPFVSQSQGRTVESHVVHERSGRVTAKLIYDVPLAKAPELLERFRRIGIVRVWQSSENPQVPETALTLARLDVTLSNADLIVPSDEGIWSQIRKGLSTSFIAISWSLIVVIVGICFVLPWVVVGYAVYRIVRRFRTTAGNVGGSA